MPDVVFLIRPYVDLPDPYLSHFLHYSRPGDAAIIVIIIDHMQRRVRVAAIIRLHTQKMFPCFDILYHHFKGGVRIIMAANLFTIPKYFRRMTHPF